MAKEIIYLHGDYSLTRLLQIVRENNPTLVFEENQRLMDEKVVLIDIVKQDALVMELAVKQHFEIIRLRARLAKLMNPLGK